MPASSPSCSELGVRVAIDDFGAGYTSFRNLQMLHVDTVKIDGSYVKDLAESRKIRSLSAPWWGWPVCGWRAAEAAAVSRSSALDRGLRIHRDFPAEQSFLSGLSRLEKTQHSFQFTRRVWRRRLDSEDGVQQRSGARGPRYGRIFPHAGRKPDPQLRLLSRRRSAFGAACGDSAVRDLAETLRRPRGGHRANRDARRRPGHDCRRRAPGFSLCAGRAGGILGHHACQERM